LVFWRRYYLQRKHMISCGYRVADHLDIVDL
jgi:hypothetical protein